MNTPQIGNPVYYTDYAGQQCRATVVGVRGETSVDVMVTKNSKSQTYTGVLYVAAGQDLPDSGSYCQTSLAAPTEAPAAAPEPAAPEPEPETVGEQPAEEPDSKGSSDF